MPRWLDELQDELQRLEGHHLRRRLTPVDRPDDGAAGDGRHIIRDGRTLLNFAGNDYLALADHPHLKSAAISAIGRWGVGSGASRLVTGHLTLHHEIESRFAAFKHAEAALICPTGYLANLAALTSLAGPGDLVCIDKLCHASLIDAARFSGADVRVYPHLHHDKLARLLTLGLDETPRENDVESPRSPRRFIVTDSVFSMDGDAADLPRLCELARLHDAILIVDEAHGTGLYGGSGAGLCEEQGVSGQVDVVISTASKAMGGLGGIITAKQPVIDTIINHARSFIYTTATPPAQVAAIGAALDVIRQEPWRREQVMHRASQVRQIVAALQGAVEPTDNEAFLCPIIPLITGSAESAIALAAHLASQGIHAPAIRPPTVAPGAARVRLSLRADMTDEDIERLRQALLAFK